MTPFSEVSNLENLLFINHLIFSSPDKLAPDACEKAKNRKRFEPKKSAALAVMLEQEKGQYYPEGGRDGPLPQHIAVTDQPQP